MSKRAQAELALAGITLLWGTTFVLIKSVLQEISTWAFLALRFVIASIALYLVYRRRLNRKGVWPAAGAGILLYAGYLFQTLGLERTTPSKSAFITGLSIPMVPLASSLVYQIRPRLSEAAGVLIASVGVALMTLPAGRAEGIRDLNPGDLLTLVCAVAFALHIVVVSHYTPLVGYETVSTGQVAAATLIGMSFLLIPGTGAVHLSPKVAAAVLIAGLLATAVAFTTMAWAQQYTTATRSALIFTLEPVIAWITSWLTEGETLGLRQMAGAGLILSGILMVEIRRGASETLEKIEAS
jgi:drug/metabolite transporter (DMT)-like permease